MRKVRIVLYQVYLYFVWYVVLFPTLITAPPYMRAPCFDNCCWYCCVVSCTVYMIDQIWGCGWNEHGNIGSGDQEDTLTLVPTKGVKTCTPPQLTAGYTTTTTDENTEVALAVGGAHYLVCTVPIPTPVPSSDDSR